MSALPDVPKRMTEAEYLIFERASETKHEWMNGQVVAMTGASRAHNLISVNVLTALKSALRGRGCEIYPADMRVKVGATGLYTYPDISVVCGEAAFNDDRLDTLLNPTVVFEILSPTTERYDRGRKFQHYRELESLQMYVLIAQDMPRIECYARTGSDQWVLSDYKGLDTDAQLEPIGATLQLAEVYEQVDWTRNGGE
jgi:Uma2 family endonuclease